MSSPHYPQSNGHAEASVKAMKALVKKYTVNGHLAEDDFYEAIMEFRNVPRSDGLSPAQILYGRSIRTRLPAHRKSFDLHWSQLAKEREKKASHHEYSSEHYDRTAHSLSPLQVGQRVRIQDHVSKLWDRTGTIVEADQDKRTYHILLQSGRLFIRNRRFLRPIKSAQKSTDSQSEQPSDIIRGILQSPSLSQKAMKKSVRFDIPRRSTRIRQKPDRL